MAVRLKYLERRARVESKERENQRRKLLEQVELEQFGGERNKDDLRKSIKFSYEWGKGKNPHHRLKLRFGAVSVGNSAITRYMHGFSRQRLRQEGEGGKTKTATMIWKLELKFTIMITARVEAENSISDDK